VKKEIRWHRCDEARSKEKTLFHPFYINQNCHLSESGRVTMVFIAISMM
jgi:hypothetical protein